MMLGVRRKMSTNDSRRISAHERCNNNKSWEASAACPKLNLFVDWNFY